MAYPITLPPLTAWRGDPFSVTLRIKDQAGAVVDLSGYGSAWTSQLRTDLNAGAVEAAFTIDATHAADLTDPRLILSLTGVQTTTLQRESWYGFDIQATGGASTPFTVWQGKLRADGDWTHA